MKTEDPVAEAYETVREATLNNGKLTRAERIALLETIKAEIVQEGQADIDNGV